MNRCQSLMHGSLSQDVLSGATSQQKSKAKNANHLLNFQIQLPQVHAASSSTTTTYPKRKPLPRKTHHGLGNKDSFLNANYRFLVSDAIDVRDYGSHAEKMVEWDAVIEVELASPQVLQCPISLDSPPVCPHVTPCGHCFSFPSIIQHLMNASGGEGLRCSAPCPLCFSPLVARELKLLRHRRLLPPAKAGDTKTFTLLSRAKDSILPRAVHQKPPSYNNNGLAGNLFAKLALVGDTDGLALWRAASVELANYYSILIQEGGLEASILGPSVFTALDSLASRAKRWHANRWRMICTPSLSSGRSLAAGAMTEEEGGEVEREAERLGCEAEAIVRDAFTALVSVTPPSLVSITLPSASSPPASVSTAPLRSIEESHFPPLPPPSGPPAPPPGPMTPPPGPRGEANSSKATHPPQYWVMREFSFDAAFSDGDEETSRAGGRDAAIHKRDSSEERERERVREGVTPPSTQLPSSSPPNPPNFPLMGPSPSTMINAPNSDNLFFFYQLEEGTMVFLHPLSLRCLLHHYGGYANCPTSINAPILELESIVQNEASRKKYPFLSHLPLSSTFILAEIKLNGIIPQESLTLFAEEIAARDKRRRKKVAEGKREAAREVAAEVAAKNSKVRAPNAEELQAMPALGRSPPSSSSSSFTPPPPPRPPHGSPPSISAAEDIEIQRAIAASLAPDSPPYPALSSPTSNTHGVGWSHMVKMGYAATGPSLGAGTSSSSSLTSTAPVANSSWGKKVTGGGGGPSVDKAGEGEGEGEGSKGGGGGKKKATTLLFTSGPTRGKF